MIDIGWRQSGGAKLKLFTWGRTKLYEGETLLEECTVEQIVTLFEYTAEEQKENEPSDVAYIIISSVPWYQ